MVSAMRPAVIDAPQALVLNQGRQQAFGPRDEVLQKVLRADTTPPLTVVSKEGVRSA